ANRRHRMRCVPDAQQTRTIPLRQPIDTHGEKLDIVPIAHFADSIAKKRSELGYRFAKRRHPPLADLLRRPLRYHETQFPFVSPINRDEDMTDIDTARGFFWIASSAW